MKKLTAPSPTTTLLLGIVVALFLLLAGWFVLVSPEKSKAADLGTQVQAAQTKLASDQHLIAATSVHKTEAALQLAARALPDTPKVSAIIRQLHDQLASSRTELQSVAPSPLAAGSNNTDVLPISLVVKGHYFGIEKLLQLLRRSAGITARHPDTVTGKGRLYTVDGIQFSSADTPGATSSSKGLIQATITLNAFVYGNTVAAPTTTTSTDTTTSTTP